MPWPGGRRDVGLPVRFVADDDHDDNHDHDEHDDHDDNHGPNDDDHDDNGDADDNHQLPRLRGGTAQLLCVAVSRLGRRFLLVGRVRCELLGRELLLRRAGRRVQLE